ncbi:hypothetical protein HYW39_01475, partial [Candidatus Curtissbacteria bacterium]|nr:hypothetical protein [Candidatus Curtissbacteria bacterium]
MNSKIKKLISAVILQASALALPKAALAQTDLVPAKIEPINNIVNVVRGAIQFILVVAFVL